MHRFLVTGVAPLALVVVCCLNVFGHSAWASEATYVAGKRTVQGVINTLGVDARARLVSRFNNVGISYPPNTATFLATKDNARLELWVGPPTMPTYVYTYSILALSGNSGPKLREGDRQVPEGIYSIEGLNPNSSYHLSLKLNYPNEFDLVHAQAEGRDTPGTNIFIHGKAVSIGCLAMGDPAVEEIFTLVAEIGRKNIEVVIAPTDPRTGSLQPIASLPWTTELYDDISEKFSYFTE